MSDLAQIMKQMDGIEASMSEFQKKAGGEIEANGKVSADTSAALDKMGETQREIADRLLAIEQSGGIDSQGDKIITMGKQFTDSGAYANFQNGSSQKARFEVQNNTLTGSDTNVAPDRKAGIVPGDSAILTLESLFAHIPTSSNAIEYTKEASFTNSAAEAAEGTEKGESALTWSLQNMPVSTVAHWLKISRQLAADAPALAAYVNQRMIYGVNLRVETQLANGNGTTPNISGIFDTGNFTAHGIANVALGSTLKLHVLVRKVMALLEVIGYMPDAILLNPADAAEMEIQLFTTAAGQSLFQIDSAGNVRLFGVPIVKSIGVTADTFAVGAFGMAGTIHDRQNVIIELSDSDDDNFTKNLVTIRAERRLALTIERPTLIIGGDLTPA